MADAAGAICDIADLRGRTLTGIERLSYSAVTLRTPRSSVKTAMPPVISSAARSPRASMGTENRLKLGFFGSNCSSGRYVTKVPERWSGDWDDNVRLAKM